jgi:ABC-type maltose transport system permease subunit
MRPPLLLRTRDDRSAIFVSWEGHSRGADLAASRSMNWLVWLGFAVVIAAIAAVTGIKPKGTRSVSHSRMMGAGRLALLAIVIILTYVVFRAHSGG